MKRLWKKQVPSFLMVLVLLVGLVPMASARSSDTISVRVDAGDSVTLRRNDFRDLFTNDRDTRGDLNYLIFTDFSGLDSYGYFSADNQSSKNVNLTERDLKGVSFCYNYRDMRYSSDYDLDTLTFHADRRAGGTVRLGFTLVGQDSREEVRGTLEIIIGRGGSSHGSGSHSGRSDVNYETDRNGEAAFDRRDFNAFYENDRDTRGSMTYLRFTEYADLDEYGSLSAVNDSGKRVTIQERDLNNLWFYYDGRNIPTSGDCDLDTLTFQADRNASGVLRLGFELSGTHNSRDYTAMGTVEISMGGGGSSSSKGDLRFSVDPGKTVSLSARTFRDLFTNDRYTRGDLDYVVFNNVSRLNDYGYFTAENKDRRSVELTERNLKGVWFYSDSRNVVYRDDCDLNTLTFTADRNASGTLKLPVSLVGVKNSEKVDATLEITVGKGGGSHPSGKGDIQYTVTPDKETVFNGRDFERYYNDNCGGSFLYVEFTDSYGLGSNGTVYSRYGYRDERAFNTSDLNRYRFYYNDARDGDYALDGLSFVADRAFTGPVTLDFRAYGTGNNRVDGTLVLNGDSTEKPVLSNSADIRYYTTTNAPVQINANDIARFYAKKNPGSTLQYVRLEGVPAAGSVYYNFYGASSYGPAQQLMTSSNCRSQTFAFSPSSRSDYALSELSYVPQGSNYCAAIPFTAYGTGSGSVAGTIYISVTPKAVAEVYGPIPKNMPVSFPVSQIYTTVSAATGTALSGIKLLELPDARIGTITCGGGGVSLAANTQTLYNYTGSGLLMNQLRFTPASGYTGPVEIPYAAYDRNGNAFAAGKLCLGVVNQVKKYKDVTSSTWCYKYVIELSDAKIIDGYKDGTFKEKNALTWGAALKLVMRAAGYSEQAPTVKNSPFSGYLAKAKADGLVSGKIDLSKPITRGQVSQLAAKALKLDTSNLSSVKPFTDTSDVYIQALSDAGIVNGYFSNGTSTFKPNNTLTRGHISAIVWRMMQYRK